MPLRSPPRLRRPAPARPASALSIGELARASRVKAETIRYYERVGLLPAATRGSNGYRRYGDTDVQRLRFIRRARSLGFALEEIRALVTLAGDPARDCGAVDAAARAHLAAVESRIAELSRLRGELQGMIARCTGGRTGDCRILEVLSGPG